MRDHTDTPPAYDMPMLEMKNFRESLEKLLKERGWNPTELARRSGVSRTQINLVRNQDRQITILRAAMIARAFGLRLEDMLKERLPSADKAEETLLIQDFRRADPAGRTVIRQVADQFANAATDKKQPFP